MSGESIAANPISAVLAILEHDNGMAPVAAFRRLVPGDFRALQELAVISISDDLMAIPCPDCGAHSEALVWQEEEDGAARSVIPCPEAGFIEIDAAQAKACRVNVAALVERVTETLKLARKPRELIQDCLWEVGSLRHGNRDVVILMGLRTDSAASRTAIEGRVTSIARQRAVLLMVPSIATQPAVGLAATIIAIEEAVSLRDGGFVIKRDLFTPGGVPMNGVVIEPFGLRAGEKLADLTVIVGDTELEFVLGDRRQTVGLADAGFLDRKSKDRVPILFDHLLRLSEARVLGNGVRKQHVSRLRTALKTIIGTTQDVLPFDDQSREYRPAFRIRRPGTGRFPRIPPRLRWNEVTILALRNDRFAITAESFATDFDPDELGLDEAGAVLLREVIRSGGPRDCGQQNVGMIRLNSAIRDFFAMTSDPFDVRGSNWTPLFRTG